MYNNHKTTSNTLRYIITSAPTMHKINDCAQNKLIITRLRPKKYPLKIRKDLQAFNSKQSIYTLKAIVDTNSLMYWHSWQSQMNKFCKVPFKVC